MARIKYYDSNTQSWEYADMAVIAGVEYVENKVTSLSAQSTDTQYPSAKCVYDLIAGVDTLLGTGVIS